MLYFPNISSSIGKFIVSVLITHCLLFSRQLFAEETDPGIAGSGLDFSDNNTDEFLMELDYNVGETLSIYLPSLSLDDFQYLRRFISTDAAAAHFEKLARSENLYGNDEVDLYFDEFLEDLWVDFSDSWTGLIAKLTDASGHKEVTAMDLWALATCEELEEKDRKNADWIATEFIRHVMNTQNFTMEIDSILFHAKHVLSSSNARSLFPYRNLHYLLGRKTHFRDWYEQLPYRYHVAKRPYRHSHG